MFKKIFLLGLISGLLAGAASLVYANVYNSALGTDFSMVAKPAGIMLTSLLACLLAAVTYYFSTRWMKNTGEIVFNLIFVLLTFVSIVGPFGTKLPLSIEMPELFPGLTVPMHFFPALAWFTLKPLFTRPEKRSIYEVV